MRPVTSWEFPVRKFRVEKRAAQLFCASLALLAGSGTNASCNGSPWLERATDCRKAREAIIPLIYLYLSKHEIFSAFHC